MNPRKQKLTYSKNITTISDRPNVERFMRALSWTRKPDIATANDSVERPQDILIRGHNTDDRELTVRTVPIRARMGASVNTARPFALVKTRSPLDIVFHS